MAGTLQYASHANFSVGMVRDIPRHLLPEGAVYDATNIVITNSGSLAKRGASSTALAAATSQAPSEMGAQRSANTDGRSRLYTGAVLDTGFAQFGSMPFSSAGQTLSTFTSSITTGELGRPTTYGDSIVFAVSGTGTSPTAWCGGADFSETAANYSASGLSITTVVGNNTINVGATAAGNIKIGGYVHLSNGTDEYTGRVVNVASPNIVVDPAPIYAKTFTSLAYYPVLPQVGTNNDGQYVSSAGCVGTFVSGGDSRIVLGNVKITTGSSTQSHPNRIMWSVREASDATVSNCDGIVQATRAGFPKLNYIDIEDIEQVIALVPIGSGNMLVVGTKQCVLLAGQLLTQSAGQTEASLGRGGLTASIRGFPQQVGCISAKSVQRTSAGVMFAAADGVYLTDGSSLINTMTNKISNLWGDSLSGGTIFAFDSSAFSSPPDAVAPFVAGTDVFAPSGYTLGVYGSANINDSHYYVSLASGGFLCDLRSKYGWTRIQAGQLEIAASTADADQTSNRIYAIKYGADATVSSTDRVIRLDPVVSPAQTSVDADGSTVNASITTKAYTEGDPAQKRRYRHTLATYQLVGGDSTYPSSTTYPSTDLFPGSSGGYFTVTAVRGLDGAGTSTLIGTTTATSTTSTVDRYDHQTLNQAVTYVIETFSAPPAFQLYEITNAFNQLRPGRVV
jgi:hypothetical protein